MARVAQWGQGHEGRYRQRSGRYAWPRVPTVVICIDGSEPAYIEGKAIADGIMPRMAGILECGADLRSASAMPSFTNPNNLSIVTGRPPAVHGIAGNFFLDRETGEKVMMNDPKFLRAPTIFSAFQKEGAKIAIVTAKDKLTPATWPRSGHRPRQAPSAFLRSARTRRRWRKTASRTFWIWLDNRCPMCIRPNSPASSWRRVSRS